MIGTERARRVLVSLTWPWPSSALSIQYCCVVLDAFSRRVVGWSIDTTQAAALVTNALGMALEGRSPEPGTILHSDHGTQFGSWAFTTRARESGFAGLHGLDR